MEISGRNASTNPARSQGTRCLAPTPDSSSHPRARFHAPQAQPWRRPYARSRSSLSSSRRVALCALGHSPAHVRNHAAACATQEDDGQIAIPYVQLEELLKHGVAAGTPSSALASSCAPPRMMSSFCATAPPVPPSGDIRKLNEAGIHTASGLMQISKRKLAQIKGLSEAKCEKIYEAGEKIAPISAWQSGKFLLEHRQANLFRLTTGCADFDKMLGGGIETKSITEVWSHFHALARHRHFHAGPRSCTLTHTRSSPHEAATTRHAMAPHLPLLHPTWIKPLLLQLSGEYRVGKSQMCMTLAVTAQLPEEIGGTCSRSQAVRRAGLWPLCGRPTAMAALLGATHSLAARSPLKTYHTPRLPSFAGGEGRALILDTEGTFRPERILEISKRFDLNGEDVLANIRVSRVRYRESLEQLPSEPTCAAASPHLH